MDKKLLVVDESKTIQSVLRGCHWEYRELSLADLANPELIKSTAQTPCVTLLGTTSQSFEETLDTLNRLEIDTLLVLVTEDPSVNPDLAANEQFCFCTGEDLHHQFINHLFLIAHQAKVIRQLRHESHCYREMVDSCPDYVFIRDRKNQIVFANTALAKLHELAPLEMVGKTYAELTGDIEGGQQAAIQDGEIISSGTPYYQHEDYYHDESGAIQWNRVSKKRIPNADSTDHFVLGVATDLTEWKKKEAQLQDSETRYRELYMREQVLGKISDTISSTSNIESMLLRVAGLIPGLFNTDHGGILGRNSETNLVIKTPQRQIELAPAVSRMVETRKNNTAFQATDSCSMVVASIQTDHEQEHFLYAMRSPELEPFTEQDAELLGAIANQCIVSITKLALHKTIQHQANHDSLTGLPNRFHFEKILKGLVSKNYCEPDPFAVLFLDLDGFKLINDSYGHLIGDQVLQVVAQRFSKAINEAGFLARMGGDEFSCLLHECRDRQQSENFANYLLEQLDAEIVVASQRFSVSASIGIARYPEDGTEIMDLMRKADSAMYHAKYASSVRVAFFDKEIEVKEKRRLQLEKDLAAALSADELELHYQPQFDLATHSLIGVESLARWQHPTLGYISPEEFVSLAEQSHLIHELGQWVITAAFRQAKKWQDDGYQLKTAINLSPRQCEVATFSTDLLDELDRFGIDSSRIEVEVTESTLMNDMESVSRHLQNLRERGISVAIDDFGTGYSSLGYLQHLPLDILKIDRSFVSSMNTEEPENSLIGVISRMAKGLGLTTVVEGVETKEQVAATTHLGCDIAQGWYFAKAMPAHELEHLLIKSSGEGADDIGRAA